MTWWVHFQAIAPYCHNIQSAQNRAENEIHWPIQAHSDSQARAVSEVLTKCFIRKCPQGLYKQQVSLLFHSVVASGDRTDEKTTVERL